MVGAGIPGIYGLNPGRGMSSNIGVEEILF